METGLVHVYTGDGKGKTTAAVGLCARAAGCGLRAGFFQFLKDGDSGEVKTLQMLGVVTAAAGTDKFTWDMDAAEKKACAAEQAQLLQQATALAKDVDVLVLDEVVGAVSAGMLKEADLLAFVQKKPPHLELVLTGRDAPAALLALADYATEMKALRHPFERGVAARRGIEF